MTTERRLQHASRPWRQAPVLAILACLSILVGRGAAENWPRWRGPSGNAVSNSKSLPVTWSRDENVRWKVELPGEGSSSPIVWDQRIFLTLALDDGARRVVRCLDRATGRTIWSRELRDENPEIASALTGHAAATPVTDGRRVVAMFGNAGAVCLKAADGKVVWRRRFGEFESELGLASSPILVDGRVILVCDHDGDRFKSFDSFLTALDLETGKTVWKTDRRGLFRSWSTPIVTPARSDEPRGARQLIVNAQDELRGYALKTGELVWRIRGMTGWVTPSPVFDGKRIFACSGKNGPTMAARLGGRGDVTDSHLAWIDKRGAPYVCSPLHYRGRLYVHNEQGVLTCFEASSGRVLYKQRLEGKFVASGIAGAGKIYLSNDRGAMFVIAAGDEFRLLATNRVGEEILASPAVSDDDLLIRTHRRLYSIRGESP